MSYKSIWDFGRQGTVNYSVHGVGEYPSKIRPIVFHHLVKRFSKEQDMILDPFSGSGTLAVEAKLQGRNSVSLDINQNAIGIVKEKLRLLGPQEMIASYRTLIGDLEKERFSLNNNHCYGLVKIDKAIKDYTDTIEKIKVYA